MEGVLEPPASGVTDAGAPAPAVVATGCPACATPLSGRLSLSGVGTLVRAHLRLERGLVHTLFDLGLRPRRMLTAYFDGRARRDYVNPITYLLLAAASSLLVFELYEDGFRAWVHTYMAREAGTLPPQSLPAANFVRVYTDVFLEVMQRTTFTSLALTLPLALLAWLLFRGPRFNLAEAVALACYAVGTGLFLHSIFVTPLLMAGWWRFAQNAGLVLYLGVPVWHVVALFGRRPSCIARGIIATLGAYAAGMLAIVVVVGVVTAFRLATR